MSMTESDKIRLELEITLVLQVSGVLHPMAHRDTEEPSRASPSCVATLVQETSRHPFRAAIHRLACMPPMTKLIDRCCCANRKMASFYRPHQNRREASYSRPHRETYTIKPHVRAHPCGMRLVLAPDIRRPPPHPPPTGVSSGRSCPRRARQDPPPSGA